LRSDCAAIHEWLRIDSAMIPQQFGSDSAAIVSLIAQWLWSSHCEAIAKQLRIDFATIARRLQAIPE
jgi:hypothetical protein